MDTIPFVVLGDGPTTHSGLGRIATDLCRHLWADRETLGIDLLQVGWPHPLIGPGVDDDHISRTGEFILHPEVEWPLWAFNQIRDWGVEALQHAYREHFGDRPGILLSVWDPGRCLGLLTPGVPVERWGYFAVDAMNLDGGISGPAGDVVEGYDRVLAYTHFGARVMRRRRSEEVWHLPHGIDTDLFSFEAAEATLEQRARTAQLMGAYVMPETPIIGCVATNMRRKDLGLYFQVLQILREFYRIPVHGWLHTNREVSDAWSVPQLAEDTKIGTALTVTLSLTDEELAGMYSRCALTIAPGLGEGFGYPIVESQACGAPVVHGDYGGGAELIRPDWRVKPRMFRLEGPYALQRPVFDPNDWAAKVAAILQMPDARQYSRSEVREPIRNHYDWRAVWPQWRRWVEEGLTTWRSR